MPKGSILHMFPDKTTYATVGDNVTIAWYYNQQWLNRTIRVFHPKEEMMMLLSSTNIPEITSTFQHRLLYSGDVSRNYMSFTLLNVKELDTGFYSINTLQWNTIPGRKQLIVKAIDTTTSGPDTGTSRTGEVRCELCSNVINDNQNVSVPIYLVIIIVTGALGVNLLMIACLIWIRWKNTSNLAAVHRRFQEKCIATSLVTPSTIRNDARNNHSNQHHNVCQKGLLGINYAIIPKDGRKVDKAYSNVCSLERQEGEKPEQSCMKKKVFEAWDEAAIDEPNWSKIKNEFGCKQDARSTCVEDLYAKVMKGPRCIPKSNRRTVDLCTDVYEMVNISLVDDPNNRLREVEIDSEASNSLLQEISNLRKNSDCGTNGEDMDDACESIITMIFAQDGKARTCCLFHTLLSMKFSFIKKPLKPIEKI
ncbi:hypothetical protein CHS0354_037844 [Potamilus streckersoni]|uniref:Uncharacterized protein n=1 Tax=Potamilus streckersoni TaxID=2493646 RepID=A0AAE0VWH5_9BIVA|nr:hypothetical protein CHS0354_037844 [Potamilus streckersoni]